MFNCKSFHGHDLPQFTFLLHSLQSPINIGQILRTAEAFSIKIYIYDSYGILKKDDNLRTINDFSCGAWSRSSVELLTKKQLESLLGDPTKCLVATGIGPRAKNLRNVSFERGDIIVLGNEYTGLPQEFTDRCSKYITIPLNASTMKKEQSHSPIEAKHIVANEGVPCLSVASAAAVIAYQLNCQERIA